ncbi:MAG: hypothetical protein H6619_03260 [Deltaproteobacteria bacterium]|nr:hypothetical protein [Deltaproteobacteria bacterium]
MVRKLSVSILCLLLYSCSNQQYLGSVPNPRFNAKADASRMYDALVMQERLQKERAVFIASIQDFDKSIGKSKCDAYEFAGFDGPGVEVGPGIKRVKTSVWSSCGASYYWLTINQRENNIAEVRKVASRSIVPGDRIIYKDATGRRGSKIVK